MNITSFENLRINFEGKGFLDVSCPYSPYSLAIDFYDFCSFWALIEDVNSSSGKTHRIVLFPDKTWFDEWYESLKEKPNIIFSSGKRKC